MYAKDTYELLQIRHNFPVYDSGFQTVDLNQTRDFFYYKLNSAYNPDEIVYESDFNFISNLAKNQTFEEMIKECYKNYQGLQKKYNVCGSETRD